MDIGGWLRSLGLEQYEAAFRDNAINETILPNLTAEDLKDLGISMVGHRRMLLEAIALLRAEATAKASRAEALSRAPKPAQDTAERRQVTVMFSDLVGSTALSGRMDPEDLREVISAYQKCVAEMVQRLGGFIAKYMGDGVLVYFGYPQAHEDDAERAVRAGLEMVAAVNGREDQRSTAKSGWYRHWAGRSRRSDWLGGGAGAWHCRRDAEPCGTAARRCRAEHGDHRREHAQASRQYVRP